ncbi:MAG: ribonuclease III [Alphaproteobacteria bacterium]|nr:ribonuclease III [Alphaproteobacteria bacterium]
MPQTTPPHILGAKITECVGHPVSLNTALLETALRHGSNQTGPNYERLEFLGDRVLALMIADMLYSLFPDSDEGGLAKRHAELVSGATLSYIGKTINIDTAISITGNAVNRAVRADVVEALIGYLYREHGLPLCRQFIDSLWRPLAQQMIAPPDNPRSTLQEWAMKRGLAPPNYIETARKGSEHAPQFCFSVTLDALGSASGWGGSKQAAKGAAAEVLVQKIP